MDGKSGEILILNTIINKTLDKNVFIKNLGVFLEDIKEEQDVFEFKDAVEIESMRFWTWIIFNHNHVASIMLENADKDLLNSYTNWSNHNVKKKRQLHDEWLIGNLGSDYEKTPTSIIFKRNWGEVTSYTDMKSGEVRISVVYY
ncbi:hypothetical protein [Metabacillus litoralis]|uniref:hypothetical protein n=1 Tax=Metabacillus litoralis TaxID=152268 RepID=UPI001CFC5A9D|nr:hypothetical protein [Metabacillus litoralis]